MPPKLFRKRTESVSCHIRLSLGVQKILTAFPSSVSVDQFLNYHTGSINMTVF